jgi:hypothetical protein
MKIIILALCFLVSSSAFAGWGVHGGFDFGNSSMTPSGSTSERTGGIAGIHYDASLLGVLTLEPGLQFARRGFNQTGSLETDSVHIDYLEIPIFLKVNIPGVLSPFVELGPNVGFKISTGCDSALGGACSVVTGLDTNSSNLLWEFGGGLDLGSAGLPTLSVALRYVLGSSSWGTTNAYTDMKHSGWELVGSLTF